MGTEEAVRRFWFASSAWRGRLQNTEDMTCQEFFKELEPLYDPIRHKSHKLASQADELSTMIVKWKRSRCPKPKTKLRNLVPHPTLTRLDSDGKPTKLVARG